MDHHAPAKPTVVLAGIGGDLGGRIARALIAEGAEVRALVRRTSGMSPRHAPEIPGLTRVPVDYSDATGLSAACGGAACVVSALNGLEPVILGVQGQLLDAAVAAGVPRFIPSDFSLDFTKTRPGDNRNLDLRRAFMARIDRTPIRATSILNGAFAELLTGAAPIVLKRPRKILYWGSADQPLDVTTKEDVARYTAAAALDRQAPRILRIAGDVVTPRDLASIMSDVTGETHGLWRAGGLGRLGLAIRIVRRLTPSSDAVFPAWQGMQYLRDMASGLGKLDPLDNDRYGARPWTSARAVLAADA
ncbi:NmrA family NAD(P)-binding protein [Methylobacterium sp. J-068]|uniref:NmrA family NAD(P)-binding protein n=1 Tax=Methylobacterium sp. J-068 TaxID=2836649 RepID=UPI001FBB91C6|nr:NmrA family NAD(P)-binding protein [Methylobacterium sp. J-068]MCJ2034256.1 NmrA family NAD(P)-binding protein [Methylobacterium sp. J-068]